MSKPTVVLGCLALGFVAVRGHAEATDLPELADLPSGEVSSDTPPSCCTLPGRWAALGKGAATPFALESIPAGERVLLDGERFADYVTNTGRQPAIWPIVGPAGHERTRSLPLGPAKPEERNDHPHHESLWFAHGDVNGHDFWHARDAGARIVHREFVRREATTDGAVIETLNDWTADDAVVVTDRRTVAFGELKEPAGASGSAPRYIDFTLRFEATDHPVTFGDTKEGTFAVRVPGPTKIDAGLGGTIANSEGQQGDDCWGQPARWVDYHGPLTVEGEGPQAIGGVTLFCHPDSFRPTCRWHVRGYGLFAANPFGASDFPAGDHQQGAITIAPGESLTLRYRAVFYAGERDPGAIDRWFDRFAAEPLATHTVASEHAARP